MIQIDMEMPEKCSECRMQTDCDYCSAMPKNFCGNTEDDGKPEWCPLKEVPDNGGWISVKDRLPEEYGNYLAIVDGEVTECTYSGPFIKGMIKGWSTCNANGLKWLRDEHVTHWMPLPEPPKEEQDASY